MEHLFRRIWSYATYKLLPGTIYWPRLATLQTECKESRCNWKTIPIGKRSLAQQCGQECLAWEDVARGGCTHTQGKTFSLPDHYILKKLDSFVKLRRCVTNFKSFDTCAIICKIRGFRVKQLKKGVDFYGQNNVGRPRRLPVETQHWLRMKSCLPFRSMKVCMCLPC